MFHLCELSLSFKEYSVAKAWRCESEIKLSPLQRLNPKELVHTSRFAPRALFEWRWQI